MAVVSTSAPQLGLPFVSLSINNRSYRWYLSVGPMQYLRRSGNIPQERKSIREAGLMISGSDDIVKSLVDPMALAQEIHLGPTTRDRAKLRVAWQSTH